MSRQLAARILLAVGGIGIVVSLLGAAVGLRAVAVLGDLVADDGVLSSDALATLEGSVQVAQDTVASIEGSLTQIEATTRDLAHAFQDSEELLGATADLSEQQIAGSVAAVSSALPGLIEAASVVDAALVALSAVPFAPAYAPPEPLDASLRRLQREMDGLPEDLEQQAHLIRQASARLGDVWEGTEQIADDLAASRLHLHTAAELLDSYAETASEATDVVADSRQALGRQLRAARVLIAVLGLVLAVGQTVPLAAGWLLLDPQRFAALLAES
jgi:methyl-accepting chemotaxis protein